MIDANVMSNKWQFTDGKVTGVHYVPGIFATIGLILINMIPASAFDSGSFGDVPNRAKFAIFFAFCVFFATLMGSGWLFFETYVPRNGYSGIPIPQPVIDAYGQTTAQALAVWLGFSVFLECILIFASAMLMRVCSEFDSL